MARYAGPKRFEPGPGGSGPQARGCPGPGWNCDDRGNAPRISRHPAKKIAVIVGKHPGGTSTLVRLLATPGVAFRARPMTEPVATRFTQRTMRRPAITDNPEAVTMCRRGRLEGGAAAEPESPWPPRGRRLRRIWTGPASFPRNAGPVGRFVQGAEIRLPEWVPAVLHRVTPPIRKTPRVSPVIETRRSSPGGQDASPRRNRQDRPRGTDLPAGPTARTARPR